MSVGCRPDRGVFLNNRAARLKNFVPAFAGMTEKESIPEGGDSTVHKVGNRLHGGSPIPDHITEHKKEQGD